MKQTNLQKGLSPILAIVAIVIVVALGTGYFIFQAQPKAPAPSNNDAMMKKEGEMMEGDKMMDEGDKMMDGDKMMEKYSGSVLAGTSSPLLDFNKSGYDKAIASDKVVVLYFYANWCPICKAEFPLAQSAFNELTTDKVIGFRVNYNDNQTDNDERNLAREFGVAYQHTKVFLKNGQRILKSPETWSKDRYISEINNSLK